jgi:hypothetical protein
MNNLQQDRRHSKRMKAHLEYLETRIVPAATHPTLVLAADLASDRVIVHSQQHGQQTGAGEPEIQVRHEHRIAKLAERREAVLERREMTVARRAARYAARHDITLAAPPQDQVIPVASTNSTSTPATTAQATIVSSPSGSGTGSSVGSTNDPKPVLAETTTSPSVPTTTSPSVPVNPLPANASVLLDTVYEEFVNGDLPASTMHPGQVEIQGSNVGIQIQTNNPSDFATIVADAESLGLQVTDASNAYDIVVGFLPIAELPSVAQLPGSPSITPLLDPTAN